MTEKILRVRLVNGDTVDYDGDLCNFDVQGNFLTIVQTNGRLLAVYPAPAIIWAARLTTERE